MSEVIQERSIIGNIKFMITGLAQAVGTVTGAINEVAKTAEALASTATVMAENNKDIVTAESNHNLAVAKNEFANKLAEWESSKSSTKSASDLLK